ncbi:MAG: hypothetical protein MI924_38645 [Chloroflexales bacterium]|nr:hypothetical protein [Chloroflexales bacterium]
MDDLGAQLTPTWLTIVLHAHGHLPAGQVAHIHNVRQVDCPYSQHVSFNASYVPDTAPAAPQHLLLKLGKPHALRAARREAIFYAHIAPHLVALSLVLCYGTGLMTGGKAYVLLADRSSSHHTLTEEPSLPHFEAMVAVLAQLHAAA